MKPIKVVLLLAIFLRCGAVGTVAQVRRSPNIDSLLKQLDKAKEDTNKVKLLTKIARAFGALYPDESIKYEQMQLSLSEKLNWQPGIAAALAFLGSDYSARGDHYTAISYMRNSAEVYQRMGDSRAQISQLFGIAIEYKALKRPDSALMEWNKGLLIARRDKDTQVIGELFVNIANEFSGMYQYDSAIVYCKMARGLADKLTNPEALAAVDGISGEAMLALWKLGHMNEAHKTELGKLDTAVKYLKMGLTESRACGFIENEIEVSRNLGEAYALLGDFQQSFEINNQAQELSDSLLNQKSNAENDLREVLLRNRDKELEATAIQLETERKASIYQTVAIVLLVLVIGIAIRTNLVHRKLNKKISQLVTEQESVIEERTKELAESNKRLAHANMKLVELIQYNAHNLREPLARVMGAMIIQEFLTTEEFYSEVWPQMQKAVNDLDNSIKDVINIADETVNLYG